LHAHTTAAHIQSSVKLSFARVSAPQGTPLTSPLTTPPWTFGRNVGPPPPTPPWTLAANVGGGGGTMRSHLGGVPWQGTFRRSHPPRSKGLYYRPQPRSDSSPEGPTRQLEVESKRQPPQHNATESTPDRASLSAASHCDCRVQVAALWRLLYLKSKFCSFCQVPTDTVVFCARM